MARRLEDQLHDLANTFEDLVVEGGSLWRCTCTCGYVTRPASDAGVAHGLWRRHIVMAGRGFTRKTG